MGVVGGNGVGSKWRHWWVVKTTDIEEEIMDAYLVSITGLKDITGFSLFKCLIILNIFIFYYFKIKILLIYPVPRQG